MVSALRLIDIRNIVRNVDQGAIKTVVTGRIILCRVCFFFFASPRPRTDEHHDLIPSYTHRSLYLSLSLYTHTLCTFAIKKRLTLPRDPAEAFCKEQ